MEGERTMTTLSWDLVDGNPAPGDRTVYRELSKDLAGTARRAETALRRLNHFGRSLDESVWRGEAADAFRAKIKALPPQLEKLYRSYGTASRSMAIYGGVLDDLQPRARSLLERAQEARRDELSQTAARDRARAEAPDSGFLGLWTPSTPFDQAVEDAQNRQRSIRRQIDDLRDQRKAAERRAADGLERAHDQGIKNDSWVKKGLQGIDKWIDKHAGLLTRISTALKIVSAIASILALIPVLTPIFLPVAGLAGGAALLIDSVLVVTGNRSRKNLAVDAALTFLPPVRAVRAGRAAFLSEKTPRNTGKTLRPGPSGAVGRRAQEEREECVEPDRDKERRKLLLYREDKVAELPGGGTVQLKGLDEQNRAQGIVAWLTPETEEGKPLTRDPADFVRDCDGKSLNYEERGHLLARQLGGPNDPRNTVSLFRPANAPTRRRVPLSVRQDMAHFEAFVRELADEGPVKYSVTPVYEHTADLMPDRIVMIVEVPDGDVIAEVVDNRY